MHKRSQWSIRRMLLWVFVTALVASHVPSFYQRQIVGFTDFSFDKSDVERWMIELDPSARSRDGGGGGGRGPDSANSEFDYYYSSKDATSGELFTHLKSKIRDQLEDENWSIRGSGAGLESFSFHASNGYTHFRIYAWIVPPESSYASHLAERGENVTRIKIFRIGYLKK